MISWRRARVSSLDGGWSGSVVLTATCEDGASLRALAHPELVGAPEVGDLVLLNVTALQLGLGTGGYALVVALPDRLPPDRTGPGHLVKARYAPTQAVVLGVEEQDSPHHDLLADLSSLPGTPVVLADLHSSLPAVVAGVLTDRPQTRVAYVMTDGAALPIWLSRTVSALSGILCGTVTVGQAYGGDTEAVTLHSGLTAAVRVLDAEVVVVTQGPGNLGTGTGWGFSGLAVGEGVNAAAAVGGRPVAVLRMSRADPRPRHRGVSHHSLTALGRVALAPADVVVPSSGRDLFDPASLPRHRVVEVDDAGLRQALATLVGRTGVDVSTMGRGVAEDPVSFLAAAAAGRHAAALLG